MFELLLFDRLKNTEYFQVLDSFEKVWRTGHEFFLNLFDSIGKKEKFENYFSNYGFRKLLKESFAGERIADTENLISLELNIKEASFLDLYRTSILQNVDNLIRFHLKMSYGELSLGTLIIDFERTKFFDLQKNLKAEIGYS